jgi:hypothetical protein
MAGSFFDKIKPEASLKNLSRLLLVVGILLLLASLYEFMAKRSFLEYAEITDGVVKSREGKDQSIISFKDRSQKELNVIISGKLEPGSTHKVYYNPESPSDFYIEDDPRINYWFKRLLSVGAILVALGSIFCFVAKKLAPKLKREEISDENAET